MTEEVATKTVCSECGVKGSASNNYCPECGEENPWKEEPLFEFDEDDFPFVFKYSQTKDFYELWKAWSRAYFGGEVDRNEISGLPDDFPSLEYAMIDLYYVITEDYELKGPFLERREARNSV